MVKQTRLIYPDACKFIAIFLVTCSHCAQRLQGDMMSNFLGGTQIDIAFNMPLFMIMSGWFLNPEKLRSISMGSYVKDKFWRLMIPAFTWYLIYDILSFHIPNLYDAMTLYWYLTSLFICLCIIFISVRLLKNTLLCAIISSVLVLCCPYSDFVRVNFMLPFLWAGYFFRKVIEKENISNLLIFVCLLMSVVLSIFWNPLCTVYSCPFKILFADVNMLLTYIYRFAIGLSISGLVIILVKKTQSFEFVKTLAKYGQYSLIIYTASVVINGVLYSFLNRYNIHFSQYVLLDLMAILVCIGIVTITIMFSNLCRKNKYASLFFLGEKK